MLIALYVDDLLMAGNDTAAIVWIKGELRQRFEMNDLGERECVSDLKSLLTEATAL